MAFAFRKRCSDASKHIADRANWRQPRVWAVAHPTSFTPENSNAMSRRPAHITQADVARVIRAARQTGAAEVEVKFEGKASIVVRFAPTSPERTGAPIEDGKEIVL